MFLAAVDADPGDDLRMENSLAGQVRRALPRSTRAIFDRLLASPLPAPQQLREEIADYLGRVRRAERYGVPHHEVDTSSCWKPLAIRVWDRAS
jgi:hypothetical protein